MEESTRMVRPAAPRPQWGRGTNYKVISVPASSPSISYPRRVAVLVDGYNLYHAIDGLQRNDLKWLNLRALSEMLVSPDAGSIVSDVLYFSAYATWRKDQYARHQTYVKALKTANVKVILGNFKRKDHSCNNCGSEWIAHEEKETDVNI